ncbi:hypothetical protein T4D_14778 [Trichinella pseudospiralis]|uniref:Uncharacterized protein n=1 Tax=Trichinella pseudospiralis TaxID=6337 RepID=A0A0V1DQ80_TRIPS|nr:hypothetical protein T4D_14778 [Trichinella pseudospiralis]
MALQCGANSGSSRSNHSVLAFTAFNNCVSWVLATGQTSWFYLYGATIVRYQFPS